jgi:ATP-binding cassette subfamily B protein
MNYALNTSKPVVSAAASAKKLWPIVREERKNLAKAFAAMLATSGFMLLAPWIVGRALDTYIPARNFQGILVACGGLVVLYLVVLACQYYQTVWMGNVGQNTLFRLRNAVFNKLQELPVAFFNQNKAGDLISRLNNDTDKLQQFFTQSLMQFIGGVFLMVGAGIFLLALHVRLGIASLLPAAGLFLFMQAVSGWVKASNSANLTSVGGMSAEIQESLGNFKVIVAFNRRDYFRRRFQEVNRDTYATSVKAGLANNVFMPVFGFSAHMAQLVVLVYGITLILAGSLTVGLLISFLAYVTNFYNPLRQLAAFWANFQVAMAGWERVAQILALSSNLKTVPSEGGDGQVLLAFDHVHFGYPESHEVLHDISFSLERGKTYALVGPTGGGKTTTASLMARLYDPTKGSVRLDGRDLRSFTPAERVRKIGFILQEPFLFTGTVRDNLLYGNDELQHLGTAELEKILRESGLEKLLVRFDQGLEAPVKGSGEGLSLGQKQLIAFMRAVIRKPELLILDEATANIDTVTEQLLQQILESLPATTTRVVIAHRLNTIENADVIFFVNGGNVVRAGSLDEAVSMLLHDERQS